MTCRSFLLAFALAVHGCKTVPTKSQDAAPFPYAIEVTMHPDAPRVGDPLEATIVLTNESSTTLRITGGYDTFDWQYALTAPDGSPAALTENGEQGREMVESGALPHLKRRVLAPGQKLSETAPLDRIFELRHAGKYRLVVSRSLRSPGDGGEFVDVRSPPVEFVLRER